MAQALKQSTATVVRMGPAADATDGVTPETGITLGAADQAELLKTTGGAVDISGNTWAAITNCDGHYDLTLTASNLDTLGPVKAIVQDSSVCVPIPPFEGFVVPGNVFDSLTSAEKIDVAVVEWNGVALATTNPLPNAADGAAGGIPTSAGGSLAMDTLADWVNGGRLDLLLDAVKAVTDDQAKPSDTMYRGTVAAGASATSVPTSSIAPSIATLTNQWDTKSIYFDGDTTTVGLRGVRRDIGSHTSGTTPTFSVVALPATPAEGDTFTIV